MSVASEEPVKEKVSDVEDDLFGDDSEEEVIAQEDDGDDDDDDEITTTKRKHRDIEANDDDDEEIEGDDDLGLGGSEDYQEGEEEEDENLQKAELSLPRHPKSHVPQDDILSFKLPRYLFVDPEPFGPEKFEESLLQFHNNSKGDLSTSRQSHVRNTIRWRYAKTEDDELYKQSNTRIIEWEDGSLSLKIGEEYFDIKDLKSNEDNLLAFSGGQVLVSTLNLNRSIQVKPTSLNSLAHKILTKSLANDLALKKSRKINAIITKEDPTKMQREVEKDLREIERARRKQALKLQMEEERLGRRKNSPLPSASSSSTVSSRYKGIDAGDDEDDYDDEDGIYNRRSRVTNNGYEEDDFVVEDDEEAEEEELAESDDDEKLEAAAERLRKVKEAGAAAYAKRPISDDAEDNEEADEEVVRKKRRVVLDEDDEDDE